MQLDRGLVFQIIEWIVYFVLVGVGIYFIMQGNVLSKYFLKRKDFTQHEEYIFEHPTIVTYLEPSDLTISLVYGKDYNVSFLLDQDQSVALTIGTNLININESYQFTVDFEEILSKNVFLVTPSNELMKSHFLFDGIRYVFPSDFKNIGTIRIGSKLTALNNSVSDAASTGRYYDGEPTTFSDLLGMTYQVLTTTKKFTYIEENKNCRNKAFNDILFTKLSEHDFNDCASKCRSNISFGKFLNHYISHLPFCKTAKEETCFLDTIARIRDGIVQKPCTKVDYVGKAQTYSTGKGRQNIINFWYRLNDFKTVTVHEEYLVFDSVSMIGSIGGTLGLCIGFSFTNVFAAFLKFLNFLWDKYSNKGISNIDFMKSEKAFATKEDIDDIQNTLNIVVKQLEQHQHKLDLLEEKLNKY